MRNINFGLCWLLLIATCNATGWRWLEDNQDKQAKFLRVDTKVHFVDAADDRNKNRQRDVNFMQPTHTAGFYNKPPDSGRYQVNVNTKTNNQLSRPHFDEGTIDSVQLCKCTSPPSSSSNCWPSNTYNQACAPDQYVCCYKKRSSETSNDIRYNSLAQYSPTQEISIKPNQFNPSITVDTFSDPYRPLKQGLPNVLFGPEGPTGQVGPPKDILVGPSGPTGIVGPAADLNNERDMSPYASAQRGVLVGPGGPTGIIGPYHHKPILYTRGGPNGLLNPANNRGVLIGPGGPTSIIGPGFRQNRNHGVLNGPGGPSGTIGPGRQILVGPGGPTGQIGPRRYFY